MLISRLKLKNWRNFKKIDVALRDRVYVIGPNASGKSNLLDVLRFLRDVAKPEGGGLQKAVKDRGGSRSYAACWRARIRRFRSRSNSRSGATNPRCGATYWVSAARGRVSNALS